MNPTPWKAVRHNPVNVTIEDANGMALATAHQFPPYCDSMDTATRIVEAVNERERLREIVRRLADLAGNLLANYEYRYSDDPNSMEFVERTRGFIAEARAAIGEGEACE